MNSQVCRGKITAMGTPSATRTLSSELSNLGMQAVPMIEGKVWYSMLRVHQNPTVLLAVKLKSAQVASSHPD